jgi:F-type H+-transporting ATPase subunit delta
MAPCYETRPQHLFRTVLRLLMTHGIIARRYARALFSLAVEQDRVEAWALALGSARQVLSAHPELSDALSTPTHPREQRRALAAELAALLQLDPEPANLLALLADRNRFSHAEAIFDTFGQLADERLGRVRARVSSARPLPPDQLHRLVDKLATSTQREVIADPEVDPRTGGGVVAQVGNMVYDGSVRTQLESLRRALES